MHRASCSVLSAVSGGLGYHGRDVVDPRGTPTDPRGAPTMCAYDVILSSVWYLAPQTICMPGNMNTEDTVCGS